MSRFPDDGLQSTPDPTVRVIPATRRAGSRQKKVRGPNGIKIAVKPCDFVACGFLAWASALGRKMASCQNEGAQDPFQQEAKDGPQYPPDRPPIQGRCRQGAGPRNHWPDLCLSRSYLA